MSIVEWEVYAAPVPVVVYYERSHRSSFSEETHQLFIRTSAPSPDVSSPGSRLPLLGDCLQQQDEHGYLFALVPVPSKDSGS